MRGSVPVFIVLLVGDGVGLVLPVGPAPKLLRSLGRVCCKISHLNLIGWVLPCLLASLGFGCDLLDGCEKVSMIGCWRFFGKGGPPVHLRESGHQLAKANGGLLAPFLQLCPERGGIGWVLAPAGGLQMNLPAPQEGVLVDPLQLREELVRKCEVVELECGRRVGGSTLLAGV